MSNYEVATGLDKQTSNIRPSVMGKDCLQTSLNLNISVEDRNNVEAYGTKTYVKTQRNVVYKRYVFNSCAKNQRESVDSYVTRLRKFASSCKFWTLTEELMVIAIIDRGTNGKFLREKSLTLDKAIDIARSNEIGSKQLGTMKSNTVTPP